MSKLAKELHDVKECYKELKQQYSELLAVVDELKSQQCCTYYLLPNFPFQILQPVTYLSNLLPTTQLQILIIKHLRTTLLPPDETYPSQPSDHPPTTQLSNTYTVRTILHYYFHCLSYLMKLIHFNLRPTCTTPTIGESLTLIEHLNIQHLYHHTPLALDYFPSFLVQTHAMSCYEVILRLL